MDRVSEYIKKQREAKGVTLEQLSKDTLISVAVLKDIENGRFDQYKGDELYVKMYLKRIADFLELDSDEIVKDYISLTQEINLNDLKEMKSNNIDELAKGTTFVDKLGDSFKNIKPSPASKLPKRVYEDRFLTRYLKFGAILVVFVAIVFVIWYAVVSVEKSKDSSEFNNNTNPTVEGEVVTDKDDTNKDNTDEDNTEETTTNDKVEIIKNGTMDYNFKLDSSVSEFTFKIEFVGRTWSSLRVNGAEVSDFEQRIYNNANVNNDLNATPEVIERTFKVADFNSLELKLGYNWGHRFYINGQQIEIDQNDYSNTSSVLKLAVIK